MKRLIFFVLFLFTQGIAAAQADSLKIVTDSLRVDTSAIASQTPISKVKEIFKAKKNVFKQALYLEPVAVNNRPAVAFIRSAVPGLGQITNGQKWKAPIVWVAAAGGIGVIRFWGSRFKGYRDLLIVSDAKMQTSTTFKPALGLFEDGLTIGYKENPNAAEITLTNARFKTIIERYRRYRDLSVIGFGVGYFLVGIEAYVKAHLKDFDVSDDISLKIEPMVQPNLGFGSTTFGTTTFGAKIQLNFK